MTSATRVDDFAAVLRRHAFAKPVSSFARDIAGLKSAFHPSRGGIGKWRIVERDGWVSISLKCRRLLANATTKFGDLKIDDLHLITRRFVVVEGGGFGGKRCRFVDFYRVCALETTGKTG